MNGPSAPPITGRLIVGGLLILFGLLFTLDNLGVLDAGDVFDYWPVIFIVIGVVRVLQPRSEGRRAFGFVLIGLGIVFQLEQLALISFDVVWPVLLLTVGGILVWRALERNRAPAQAPDPSRSTLSDFAFMGGVHRVVENPDFRGGEATAVMGAVELDLRGSSIVNSPAVIDVFALWGGIEITVPPEWTVDVKGLPLLGGFDNKARSSVREAGGPGQVLVVRGTALMGGVEIKN
jgi:predicted membrane protein